MLGGDIDKLAAFFAQEMVVSGGVGVKIGAPALNAYLAQQFGSGELVERVIDGCKRHEDANPARLAVQRFRRHMAAGVSEKQLAQQQALACGSKPCGFELIG